MSDPNYNPQQYPNQDQQTYQQPQYAQPQDNPYANGQQYTQPQYAQPQYSQPQYSQPQYVQPQYVQPSYMPPQPADTGSFGWAVLGFFFPLVGLILFLVWKDEKPVSAKQAGMGALVSVIVDAVLWLLIVLIVAALGSVTTY